YWINLPGPTLRAGPIEFQRQQDRKHRAPRFTLAFDGAIVLRDKRLGNRETEAASTFAAGDQRVKDFVANGIRDAGTVVRDRYRERQPVTTLRQRDPARHTRLQLNYALVASGLQRLRGVFHDVEHRLRQLLWVGVELGQADVEVGMNDDVGRFRLNKLRYTHQSFMGVGAPLARQSMWGEQAVHQGLQPIGLTNDDLRVLDQLRTIQFSFQ